MQSNGESIIKIGKKGRVLFQFRDCEPFAVSVIMLQNQWAEIDRTFRDEEMKMQPGAYQQWLKALWDFVSSIEAKPGQTVAQQLHEAGENELDPAEALEFINLVNDECDKLVPFFERKSKDEPSSRENITPRYST